MATSLQDQAYNELIRSQVDLLRLNANTQKKVTRLFGKMQKELIQEISSIDPAGSNVSKWRESRLRRLNKSTTAIIGNTYGDINNVVNGDLIGTGKIEHRNAISILNTSLGTNVLRPTFTDTQVKVLVNKTLIDGATIGNWWKDQAVTFKKNFNRTARDVSEQIAIGSLKGDSIGELTKRVKGVQGIGGLTKGAKNAANSLTRTAFMQTANDIRNKTYDIYDDVLSGYEYIATLDNRTTPYCRAADGKKYNKDYTPIGHTFALIIPPAHWQCRSTLLPITKTWDELAGPKSRFSKNEIRDMRMETTPTHRAMMGGTTKSSVSYNQWLKKQPVSIQEEVLGVEKRKLWLKGKLTMPDMVDQTGRPLTVLQLETLIVEREASKVAVAKRKARERARLRKEKARLEKERAELLAKEKAAAEKLKIEEEQRRLKEEQRRLKEKQKAAAAKKKAAAKAKKEAEDKAKREAAAKKKVIPIEDKARNDVDRLIPKYIEAKTEKERKKIWQDMQVSMYSVISNDDVYAELRDKIDNAFELVKIKKKSGKAIPFNKNLDMKHNRVDNINDLRKETKAKYNITGIGNIDKATYGKVEMDYLNDLMEEIGSIYEELPKLREMANKKLNKSKLRINLDLRHDYLDGGDSRALADYWNSNRMIRMSRESLKPRKPNLDLSPSWHTDSGARATFRHEYGHHVEMMLTPSTRTKWGKLFDSNKEVFRTKVSQYGTTNSAEGFAESFAAYTSKQYDRTAAFGSKHRLPEFIEKEFDRLFK